MEVKLIRNSFWNNKWVLSISIGILLGLSWPPLPFPFLIFPAFFLLFRLIDRCRSAREAASYSYLAFLIWNIIVTYWLTFATLYGGIAAIIANAALMMIPVMLQYKIQRRLARPWLIALLQTACWMTYEYLHHQWDLAWPWLTLGNAWANVPQLIQYISVTGYWGISCWILLSCTLAYQSVKTKSRPMTISAGICVLIFPLWSSALLFLSSSNPSAPRQQVAVAQPNFDAYKAYGGYGSYPKAMDHIISLTDSVRTPQTKAVFWPENAVLNPLSNRTMGEQTKLDLHNLAQKWNASIITGATYFQYFKAAKAPALTYSSSKGPYLPYNAALGFEPNHATKIYRKHNLVPVVERIPFAHALSVLDVFGLVNWGQIQGYGEGHHADQFRAGSTKVPALICYDSVFPSWARQFVQRGAGYLSIITNDGWWGKTSGPYQHFAYARLRAVELHRWVVRSANNGISGIIDPSGALKVKTEFKTTSAFRYDVPVLHGRTFYARFGDWLPQLMLIIALCGVIFLCLINYRNIYT